MSESSKLVNPISFSEGTPYAFKNRKLSMASECFH
jgi:hypothetical protein